MSALQSLEAKLDDLLVKNAPALSLRGKEALLQNLPWINLFFAVVTVYALYVLWHWAHLANSALNYANSLSAATGGSAVIGQRLTIGIWFGLIVLAVEAGLYIAAFRATRERQKSGWNLMFYAALVNITYSVVVLFTEYGGIGNLVASLIGSGIGLYLLFQIRADYGKTPPTPTP